MRDETYGYSRNRPYPLATHGKPSEKMPSPCGLFRQHSACPQIGIIENYVVEAERALIKKGTPFASETDTEVIAHLIENTCPPKRIRSGGKQISKGRLRRR